jgi:hypothetical protein
MKITFQELRRLIKEEASTNSPVDRINAAVDTIQKALDQIDWATLEMWEGIRAVFPDEAMKVRFNYDKDVDALVKAEEEISEAYNELGFRVGDARKAIYNLRKKGAL